MADREIDANLIVHGTAVGPSMFTIVNHGATASTPRPTTTGRVWWFGTVSPSNIATGDIYTNLT